jgi:hypothetical protein
MRINWTRENIIRHIVEHESQGLPLTVGGKGVGLSMYAAARRTFGSWRNALQAAGIAPKQAPTTYERWSPKRILVIIRRLAQRKTPLTIQQLEYRYHRLVSAARRHFGSWAKAALAAGVEPSRLQRVVAWNPERVIEAILTRSLRNESLVARQVKPYSLAVAGRRFFGDWPAAVSAAGLDPALTVPPPPRRNKPSDVTRTRVRPTQATSTHRKPWNKERVIAAILVRLREQKPMHSTALSREDHALYHAMRRHLKSWNEAMRAAGLDPDVYRRSPACTSLSPQVGPRVSVARQSQTDEMLRLQNTTQDAK